MSNAADVLLIVSRLITVLDSAITLSGNSEKFRKMVAKAVAEGRDLTYDELNELRSDAQEAVDKLGE